ncbi:nucleoporin Nup43-like isoform X3 [Amphibalanus amphitrite]|uniref:nucleoporin Nup43-like isoform X3 n=1 Tax=Amphibalanus amphitrite TaxID=1232801 RepID=UPI001C92119B|nr:nucleoporin Nup43-like isoform X3 [Amphibalanus amphitrite]
MLRYRYPIMSEGIRRINTFVSTKISCVRWRPTPQDTLTPSSQFVSGSWDDEENCLQLWQWSDSGDDPRCLHRLPCRPDVNCLSYVSLDVFAAATSDGDVTLYRHVSERLEPGRRWDRLHRTKRGAAPCTWLSAFEQELVSVGDDGRMVVLNMHSQKPGRVIAADTCSVYRVQHVTHSHVVTANMRGQLKSWDLRADSDEPTSSVMASQQQCAVTALARHPTQYHVLASGDGDGVICIWDMRQPRFPVTELKSHADEVSDLLFHRLCPDSLFSAAHDGSVCQWNIGTTASSGLSARLHTSGREPPADAAQTSWLTLDASKRYLDVLSLLPAGPLPVNSLDVSEDRLVCGGDNEVIHCVSQLTV